MDIYDILFDVAEALVPLSIFGLILIWMMRDVPKEDRPWAMLKRRITGNLNKEEMEAKKERSDMRAEATMMASRFAFTNVPRHLLRLAIVVFVGGFVYSFVILSPMDTSDWKPVDATIVDTGWAHTWCEENFEGGCHYEGHFPNIRFTWQIDEVTYESERYTFNPVNLSSWDEVQIWLEDYPEGSATTAYYNPDNPSDAVLITHNLLEAYGYSGNWFEQICLSIFCLPIPLMLWITVLRFERTLPEHRGKRFKLSINPPSADSFWKHPSPELLQLQKEARNRYLKQNYEKFGDSFQEAMEIAITVLRFERTLPEHRGKRFKLSINPPSADSFWKHPSPELLQLQKEARNRYLKQNYEKFGDSFQEAMEIAEELDAETEELSGEFGNFHIIADGVEKEIKVKSVGELFRKIGDIFEDSGTLFLEDSKQDGRRLDFEFNNDDVIVRELNGEDLVLEETLGEEVVYGRILEILKNALAKTTEEDEEWWS